MTLPDTSFEIRKLSPRTIKLAASVMFSHMFSHMFCRKISGTRDISGRLTLLSQQSSQRILRILRKWSIPPLATGMTIYTEIITFFLSLTVYSLPSQSCSIFEHGLSSKSERERNSITLTELAVRFSNTRLARVLDFRTRSWKACAIFEHAFWNKPEGASKSVIFLKPCTIFEHTFRVWCSIFDHQTQMAVHIERFLMVPVGNSNTSLENRVRFSNTVLEFVIENRAP